ncbi:hypothetical protein [uncultured Marinobacter sp.]|uniref:hypothetical protein n=1 Tax=uncultured Marinobacter sp. TaxID=187379 RepID=UPI002590A9F8|nr:hypothetical protein [uncultured Marinobacter sp.]
MRKPGQPESSVLPTILQGECRPAFFGGQYIAGILVVDGVELSDFLEPNDRSPYQVTPVTFPKNDSDRARFVREWLVRHKDATRAGGISLMILPLAACSSSSSVSVGPEITDQGYVIDGYIEGASVSRLNESGNTVLTDETGAFNGLTGKGAIVAEGGIDLATGMPFLGQLRAPEGAGVVTPLTTLVEALVAGQEMTLDNANAKVSQTFGLGEVELTTLDPLAAGTENLEVYRAGVQIANMLNQAGTDGSYSLAESLADTLATESDVSLADLVTDPDFLESMFTDPDTGDAELGSALARVLADQNVRTREADSFESIAAQQVTLSGSAGDIQVLAESGLGFASIKVIKIDPISDAALVELVLSATEGLTPSVVLTEVRLPIEQLEDLPSLSDGQRITSLVIDGSDADPGVELNLSGLSNVDEVTYTNGAGSDTLTLPSDEAIAFRLAETDESGGTTTLILADRSLTADDNLTTTAGKVNLVTRGEVDLSAGNLSGIASVSGDSNVPTDLTLTLSQFKALEGGILGQSDPDKGRLTSVKLVNDGDQPQMLEGTAGLDTVAELRLGEGLVLKLSNESELEAFNAVSTADGGRLQLSVEVASALAEQQSDDYASLDRTLFGAAGEYDGLQNPAAVLAGAARLELTDEVSIEQLQTIVSAFNGELSAIDYRLSDSLVNLTDPANSALVDGVNEEGYRVTDEPAELGSLNANQALVLLEAANFSETAFGEVVVADTAAALQDVFQASEAIAFPAGYRITDTVTSGESVADLLASAGGSAMTLDEVELSADEVADLPALSEGQQITSLTINGSGEGAGVDLDLSGLTNVGEVTYTNGSGSDTLTLPSDEAINFRLAETDESGGTTTLILADRSLTADDNLAATVGTVNLVTRGEVDLSAGNLSGIASVSGDSEVSTDLTLSVDQFNALDEGILGQSDPDQGRLTRVTLINDGDQPQILEGTAGLNSIADITLGAGVTLNLANSADAAAFDTVVTRENSYLKLSLASAEAVLAKQDDYQGLNRIIVDTTERFTSTDNLDVLIGSAEQLEVVDQASLEQIQTIVSAFDGELSVIDYRLSDSLENLTDPANSALVDGVNEEGYRVTDEPAELGSLNANQALALLGGANFSETVFGEVAVADTAAALQDVFQASEAIAFPASYRIMDTVTSGESVADLLASAGGSAMTFDEVELGADQVANLPALSEGQQITSLTINGSGENAGVDLDLSGLSNVDEVTYTNGSGSDILTLPSDEAIAFRLAETDESGGTTTLILADRSLTADDNLAATVGTVNLVTRGEVDLSAGNLSGIASVSGDSNVPTDLTLTLAQFKALEDGILGQSDPDQGRLTSVTLINDGDQPQTLEGTAGLDTVAELRLGEGLVLKLGNPAELEAFDAVSTADGGRLELSLEVASALAEQQADDYTSLDRTLIGTAGEYAGLQNPGAVLAGAARLELSDEASIEQLRTIMESFDGGLADIDYRLKDSLANLSDPENDELIANVNEQGYELTNASGDLGELTSAEARVLNGASNFSSNDEALYTFDLFDSPEELAAEGNETILEKAEVIRVGGDATIAELSDIITVGEGELTLLKLEYVLADTPENLREAPEDYLSNAISITARYELGAEPTTIAFTPEQEGEPDLFLSVTGFKLDDSEERDSLTFDGFGLNSETILFESELQDDTSFSDSGVIIFDQTSAEDLSTGANVQFLFSVTSLGSSFNSRIESGQNDMIFLIDSGDSADTNIWHWTDENENGSVQASELQRIGELLGVSNADLPQLTNININLPEPDSSLM